MLKQTSLTIYCAIIKNVKIKKIHILIQSVKIFYQQILLVPRASNFQDLVAPLKNQLGGGKWAPSYFNPRTWKNLKTVFSSRHFEIVRIVDKSIILIMKLEL